MKFYNYSVKNLLKSYFGENTVFEMRKPHDSVYKRDEDEKHILELSWQYADERVVGHFLGEVFLKETIIEDDYIVYLGQFQNEPIAYIMFMVTEDEPYFHIDITYARQLINEWESKGYRARIFRQCICVDYYGINRTNGFRLTTHITPGHDAGIHELTQVNGDTILTFAGESCWEYYYHKLISVVKSNSLQEYECLFERDAIITEGDEKGKNKRTLSTGIDSLIEFFSDNIPVVIAYQDFKSTKVYSRELIAGNNKLIIHVDRRNLISEINIVPVSLNARDWIIDRSEDGFGSLVESIPDVIGFRVLDPAQMHGYAVQIEYAGENVRNYYLCNFDSPTLPDNYIISGFSFTQADFLSAKIAENGILKFRNGYSVPKHLLYYHSYRQVQICKTSETVYDKDGVIIESLYKLPLKQFMGHFIIRQYRGYPDECFGPTEAWIDKKGNRCSDIAIYKSETSDYNIGAACVCIEPTCKYGFINEDGTWLVPPIYTTARPFSTGCAKATRIVDGEEKTFLITEDGKEVPFNYPLDVDAFTSDRCQFSNMKWKGDYPDAGYYYDYDWVKPGNWGFIDSSGNIIVEPQYVYAIGFYNGGGKHSIVARLVDGAVKWGIIDLDGHETVPCEYQELYTRWGDLVGFKRFGDEKYGVMDFDGYVILEPQFGYFEEYDEKHRLITAGNYKDEVGVYSLDFQRFIIPCEYECIDYGDHMISCDIPYDEKEKCFDYSGKELLFEEYDSVFEADGMLSVWKNGKRGVIDWDGNIVIPPVMAPGFHFDKSYFKLGLIITGDSKRKGLSRTNREVVLPEIYSDIYLHGEFVIASERNACNWGIQDTLFTTDGAVVLEGLYRNMRIKEEEKLLTASTPTGFEVFKIITEKALSVKQMVVSS